MAAKKSGPRVALYCRVSTMKSQDVGLQLRELREFAARGGWDVVEYVDEGQSGRKESRPAFDRMMKAVRQRRYDRVVVWRLDRLSRGLRHAVNILSEFKELGVEFISLRDGLSFTGPLGLALYALVAALAEAEVEALRERTLAGLRNARAKGKRLGRPPVDVNPERLRILAAKDLSIRELARRLGVSRGTASRALQSLDQGGQQTSAEAIL